MQPMLGRNVVVLFAGALALAHCGPGSMPDTGTPDVITMDTPAPMDTPDAAPPIDVPADDMGSTSMCGPNLGPCNPATGAGCPDGQFCFIVSGATGGEPTGQCGMPGPVGPGMPCASANACQSGLQCLNNVCTRMCCALGDNTRCRVAGGRDICVALNLRGSTAMLFNCEPTANCDWFAQNCPMATQTCLPILPDGTTQCQTAGTQTAGMPCGGSMGGCARGLICAGPTSDMATCRQICNPLPGGRDGGVPDGGVSMDCPSGQTCHPLDAARYPQNFGACLPM